MEKQCPSGVLYDVFKCWTPAPGQSVLVCYDKACPVDCVTDTAATKATCTASCGTVPAVASTPAANGGNTCSAYTCQVGDGACQGCSMVKDPTKPNWYGGVAIANPAGPGTYNPNWIYEFGPLSEQQCQDLCISTPACKRTGWRSNAHPESCTMFSSVGPYAPGQSVLVCYDKACPVDCVTDTAATKATCTASCGTVPAVASTPAANGGNTCSAYTC